MNEAELKKAVTEYLDYRMNLGELYWDRLPSGEWIEVRGNTRRRVRGCREGTADILVLKKVWFLSRTIFLELKGEKGRQSKEQKAFQILVESQSADYFLIYPEGWLEKLEGILR